MIVIVASNAALWLYLAAAMAMAFAATYTWFIWSQVGGIRGAMTGVLLTALCGMALCLSVMHANDARVPLAVPLVFFRAMWFPVVFAVVILADLYAADHNDHRSLTTRSYQWYKRVTSRTMERPRSQRRKEMRNEA